MRFGEFRATYFPPGCVIRDLEVRPAGEPNSPPVVTIQRLTVTSNYREIWHHRVETMRLEDVHVDVPRGRATAKAPGEASSSEEGSQGSSAERFDQQFQGQFHERSRIHRREGRGRISATRQASARISDSSAHPEQRRPR